jgi:hypothetical protein
MRPRAIQLNALDKGKSSSRARYRRFSRDIDLVVDRHERNTTHSPSRPYKPDSSKAVYTARIFPGTPGGVGVSSAPLEALETALRRSLLQSADRVPKGTCAAHSTQDAGYEMYRRLVL